MDAIGLTTTTERSRLSDSGFSPLSTDERSQWLDALRGFALLGILLYNIQGFSGHLFGPLLPPAHHVGAMFDRPLDFVVHALIEGKFYSLFSFLFGLGFALQIRRAAEQGAEALPMLWRRMAWLLVIGLTHALLIWFGDILSAYAVLGFVLLLFRNLSQRMLLGWALFFLLLPVPCYLVFLAVGMGDPMATPAGNGESVIAGLVRAVHAGDYFDVVRSQSTFYGSGWLRRAVRLALPRILGMFLLGVWVARLGFPQARDAYRHTLRRWLWAGIVIGLPLNLGYAALGSGDALLPASATGLLAIVLSTFGIPLLCMAYVAAFALYWHRARPRSLLLAAGRVPLSHYLGQSLVCVPLFYGFGLGLFGRISYGVALLIAIAVWLLLAWLARAWLRRHPQGPMEMLWRRLSYAGSGRAAALAES